VADVRWFNNAAHVAIGFLLVVDDEGERASSPRTRRRARTTLHRAPQLRHAEVVESNQGPEQCRGSTPRQDSEISRMVAQAVARFPVLRMDDIPHIGILDIRGLSPRRDLGQALVERSYHEFAERA